MINQLLPSIDNKLMEFVSLATPVGIVYFLNYYVIAPLTYRLINVVWHLTGHYNYFIVRIDKVISNCADWLVITKLHWGTFETSDECQNANTCEGLIALKKAGLDKKMSIIYKETLKEILSKVTDIGLESKSLKKETVVCTSMILYLFALERNNFDKKLRYKFDKIATNLWSVHGDRGWGVYISKSDDDYSIANTFWTIRALIMYNEGKSNEFKQFVLKMFEYSNQSLFGYVIGDYPRLCTTSMSIIIYFTVDEKLRLEIDNVYNIKDAINYVFNTFCIRGVQYEIETLKGIDKENLGAKKAPWNHISIGFAIEALNLAYQYRKLNLFKMNILIERIKKICKDDLVYPQKGVQNCYYMPARIEIDSRGIYTFPTAYLIMGLSSFKILNQRKNL